MRTYLEIRTARHDGSEVIVRERVLNLRDGLFGLLKYHTEGWYWAKNQHSTLVYGEKELRTINPMCTEDLMYPKGICLKNDFGEHTLLCLREYGDRAQVSEGTFYV